jgi:hypothetical protein
MGFIFVSQNQQVMKKSLFSALLTVLFGFAAYGQGALSVLEQYPPEDPYHELAYYFTGLNYLTNSVYMARKDSAAVPYITPYVGYHFSFGLYVKGTASYAPLGSKGQFDLYTFKVGYDHKFRHSLWAGASFQRNFFHRNSPSIRAGIDQTVNAYAKLLGHILEPRIDITANSGMASDVNLAFGVSHDFRFFESRLMLTPIFTVNAGPLGFYDSYFRKRQLKIDGSSQPFVVQNAGEIRPLTMEFSGRATWRSENLLCTFVPTFAIPLSEAKIVTDGIQRKEITTPTVFLELDICYRHERK